MKTAYKGILSFAFFVLLQSTGIAQTAPPVSGATLLGTFVAEVKFESDDPYFNSTIAESEFEFVAWSVSGGQTVISVNVNSAEFAQPCEWAETIPLDALIGEAATDGLRRAIELGYVICPSTCPSGNGIKVYYPTCVNRNINGSCPVLTAEPSSDYSYNTYDVCCEGGSPAITLMSRTCGSSSCGTGYQRTCGS